MLAFIGFTIAIVGSQFFTYTYIGGDPSWTYVEITNPLGFYLCIVFGFILAFVDNYLLMKDKKVKLG